MNFAVKLLSTAAVVGLTSFAASATASPSLLAADGHGANKQVTATWPVGQPRGPEVDSPTGDQRAVVLTGDHLVYVAILREGTTPDEYRLSIRQF